MTKMVRNLLKVFGRAFARNRDGAVALQFALLAVPLIMLGLGLADLNRASGHKTQLQNAVDAAALIVARSTANTDTAAQSVGSAALTAQLSQITDGTLSSSSFTIVNGTVVASAQMSVAPIVSNIWLAGNMTVGAAAEVKRSTGKVEMVLALDTTGSMADNGKMDSLKVAAKNLIDQLAASAATATTPNTVKIGIVPFAQSVKLGTPAVLTTLLSSTWLDTTGISPIHDDIFTKSSGTWPGNRFTLFTSLGHAWQGCVESRPAPYDIVDTSPSLLTPATLIVPWFAPDEPDPGSIWNWFDNGDFGDFENNYKNDVTYSSSNWKIPQGIIAKYLPGVSGTNQWGDPLGPNWMCNMQPISRLSTDWTALKAKVDSFVPNGGTNTHIGAMWAWHLLSPNAPFSDGVAYGTAGVTKIAVIMTDGANNYTDRYGNDNHSDYGAYGYIWQGRLDGLGTTSTDIQRRDAMDVKFKAVCTNMKAQNIKVYTIAVMVDATAQGVLQTCSSGTDYYFNVTDSAQMSGVFATIAGQISNLAIAK